MITRADILILGLNASVIGALVGGLLLGIGLAMVVNHQYVGWLLMLPAGPAAGLVGLVLARRLARKIK